MKKISMFLLIMMRIVFLASCARSDIANNADSDSFAKITYSELTDAVKKDDTMFVLYGIDNCSACYAAKEKLKKASDSLNINVYYLDGDSDEGIKFADENGIPYAPYLICIKSGEYLYFEDFNDGLDNILSSLNEDSHKDRFTGLENISYSDLKDRRGESEDFLLYIGRDDCRDCQKFNPIVEELTSEKYGMYYFNIKEYRSKSLDENASEEDIALYDSIKSDFEISWVPSVYRIINGNIVSKYEFLDSGYYDISDDNEKEQYLQKYIDEFYEWFSNNY